MTDGNTDAAIISELAKMIGAIGTIDFGNKLDGFVASLADYDMTAICAFSKEKKPIMLHDGNYGKGKKFIWDDFLNSTYLVDIVYQGAIAEPRPGLYRLNDLAPTEFFARDSHSGAVHPCISADSGSLAEEIVFYVSLSCGAEAAYSVMRNTDKSIFNDSEFSRLKYYEQVICNAMERNWESLEIDEPGKTNNTWSGDTNVIELGLETFATETLTRRERMVVGYLLQGHSVIDTARELSIAPGTVKNHKKNIYLKLAISSLSELFSLFIRHISNSDNKHQSSDIKSTT